MKLLRSKTGDVLFSPSTVQKILFSPRLKSCADIEKWNFANTASIEISIKPTHSQRKFLFVLKIYSKLFFKTNPVFE